RPRAHEGQRMDPGQQREPAPDRPRLRSRRVLHPAAHGDSNRRTCRCESQGAVRRSFACILGASPGALIGALIGARSGIRIVVLGGAVLGANVFAPDAPRLYRIRPKKPKARLLERSKAWRRQARWI